MESRTPDQVGNDIVLCKDETLWKWSDFYGAWVKLPPIPTDEDYETSLENMKKLTQQFYKGLEKKR